jgi:hypothetical protein
MVNQETSWFYEHWARVTIPLALLVMALLPAIYAGLGIVPTIVLLQLPLYMFHQFEEHATGRFGAYVNDMVAQGRPLFDYRTMFYVNTLLVWIPILAAFYLSAFINPVLGLAAPYLVALNASLHLVVAAARREANPGFYNSLVDLPAGIASIVVITQITSAGWAYQGVALLVAVLIHAAIPVFIGGNLRALRQPGV